MSVDRPLPFILAASDLGPMIVSRLDFAKNNHGYYGVGFQILNSGSYDKNEIKDVLRTLDELRVRRGDGLVVVDGGANIGVHSIAIGRHVLGWGTVQAFEAQERLYYALCGNIALMNLFNVFAYHVALGTIVGTIDIPQPDYLKSGSLGSLELNHNENNEFIGQPISYAPKALKQIAMVSIDSLNLPRCDFIKLDIEGMELAALEGARETISKFRPILLIEWIKAGQAPLEEFMAHFEYSNTRVGMNLIFCPKEMK